MPKVTCYTSGLVAFSTPVLLNRTARSLGGHATLDVQDDLVKATCRTCLALARYLKYTKRSLQAEGTA